MQHLVRVANLCNNCVYEIGVDEQGREIQDLKGDASEKGITRFINAHLEGRFEDYREQYVSKFAVPFNSANKWQLSVHLVPKQHVAAVAQAKATGQTPKLLTIPDPSQFTLPKSARTRTHTHAQSTATVQGELSKKGQHAAGCMFAVTLAHSACLLFFFLPLSLFRYNPFLYLRGKKEPVKVNLLGRPARRNSFDSYHIDKLPKPLIDQHLLARSSNTFQRVGIRGADSSLTFNPRHNVQQQLHAELAKSKAAKAADGKGAGAAAATDGAADAASMARLMKLNSSTFAPMHSGPATTELSMADAFASLRGEALPSKKEEEQKQLVPAAAASSSNASAAQLAAIQSGFLAAPPNSSDEPLLVVKGASEQILAYCDKYMLNGEVRR